MPRFTEVVRITAEHPVEWSLDNGLSRRSYEPGEVYELPLFAVQGMVANGWAVVLDRNDVSIPTTTELPSFIKPKEQKDKEEIKEKER